MRSEREYDVVVFGATGFAGRLVARYLADRAPSGTRIALAGRSAAKLAEARDGIPGTGRWALITADSQNAASLEAMAGLTRVVLTTVGPYLRYGLPLVAACAKLGTHYVDLTGETLFIRHSIDQFDTAARASGARIVHSCGFDSIPSDLGVYALHRAALRDGDGSLGLTKYALISASGGVSGGTAGSAINQFAVASADPAARRILSDPYALSPDRAREPPTGGSGDLRLAAWDSDWQSWVAPFVMSVINTRIVRRSNALLGYAYSRDFRYQEMVRTGSGPLGLARAVALAAGTAVGAAALMLGPSRTLASRFAPKPGEGPSEESMRNGRFTVRLISRTPGGEVYRGQVSAQGDPGYLATARMIGESALALALDEAALPDAAGVLTPATALGERGIERLVAAGMEFTATRD